MTKVRITGHLGELLQGRIGPSGPVALITLPAPGLWVEATCLPGPFQLHQPDSKVISRSFFRSLCRALKRPLTGRWLIRAHMPVAAGAGSSTAALLAISKILRPDLSRQELEKTCLSIEHASDPLLAPAPERMLWASREARVIQVLPAPPPMQVIGGFTSGFEITNAQDNNFPDIQDLIEMWPTTCHDISDLGRLISESARRRMAQLGRNFNELEAIASNFDAAAISIAHTGTARAFIFPPDHPSCQPLMRELSKRGWKYLQNYQLGKI